MSTTRFNFAVVRKVILYSLVIGLIFVSGYYLGSNGFKLDSGTFPKVKISREIPANHLDADFSLFWKVWDTLDSSYYDKSKIDTGRMVYGAISGMVSALGDPYTAFLPPEENKVVEEDLSGSFEGVGIQIGFKGKNLAVMAPLPDSPAEKAGVKAGDFIVGIIDTTKKIETNTVGMNLNDAVKIIRGKAGTKVTLVLLRDGSNETIKKEITREALDVPSVITTYVEDNSIAHIKLVKFGADTDSEWQKAVNEVVSHQPKVKGIVLDLRNNPGGYLQSAVDIAGEFVKQGSVVVIEDKGGSKKTEYKTDRTGKFQDMKVVILVNGGSASASEILAGALSETKGYKLVGDKTFGKGTIQEPLQLEKGSSLHITIAKWLTPKGNWVHEKGIEPDEKVEDKDDTAQDEQLDAAIKLLK
jgi:carboxyl-terminal processing protease